jgi:hypothetical protein
MIKINERTYLAAHAIKAIVKSEYHEYINVQTFDGECYTAQADYGKSIYDKLDELVAAVQADSEPSL